MIEYQASMMEVGNPVLEKAKGKSADTSLIHDLGRVGSNILNVALAAVNSFP